MTEKKLKTHVFSQYSTGLKTSGCPVVWLLYFYHPPEISALEIFGDLLYSVVLDSLRLDKFFFFISILLAWSLQKFSRQPGKRRCRVFVCAGRRGIGEARSEGLKHTLMEGGGRKG
jgi:hypothetical protein